LFFIGWNTSLALSGVFYVAAILPVLHFGLGRRIQSWTFVGLIFFGLGLAAGSVGALFAQLFSHTVWHRLEFGPVLDGQKSNLRIFAETLASTIGLPRVGFSWYHVSFPLTAMLAGSSLVALSDPSYRRRGLFLVGFLACISLGYAAWQTPSVEGARYAAGGLLRSFQFDRFYFLYSFLTLCIFIVGCQSASKWGRNLILCCCVLQGVSVIYLTPHWRHVLGGAPQGDTVSAAGFESYYHRRWFVAARPELSEGAVLSVGVDPMMAPMNSVPSIDGYYVMYPLEYKHQFREIIRDSLRDSGRSAYFDRWGSRVYTFHAPGHPERIDFCAARRLGARHVISRESITSPNLQLVPVNAEDSLLLYKILCTPG
jgi:hypothetical protein